MARVSMIPLVERVRENCGIAMKNRHLVTDDMIESALDRTRIEYRQLELKSIDDILAGGDIVRTIWVAPWEDWEGGVVLQSGTNWNVITPATEDLLTGRWTFATDQLGGVFLSGFTYDTNGATAEIARKLAATELRNFDFAADGQSFSRQQIKENYRELAREYAALARPITASLERADRGDA